MILNSTHENFVYAINRSSHRNAGHRLFVQVPKTYTCIKAKWILLIMAASRTQITG